MKRVLLFHGGMKKYTNQDFKKLNFSHSAQLFTALKESKNIDLSTYGKKEIFSGDFFSGENDLVVSIGFFSFYFILMKKLGFIRCPVLHSWNDDYHKCGGIGGKWMRKKIEYWTVKNADYNLTCSKYRYTAAKKMRAKIKFIPHGILDDWNKIKAKKLKGFNLVYIGELSFRKGSNKIIELAKNFPELNFHFFGRIKKNERGVIETLPKNIIFHGWVKNEEAISYCKGADILLHPTDNDSTLKVYTFIRCGKPILAIKGQVEYLLEHKKNAYITDDFEKGLKELLKNKGMRDKISKNLKKYKIYYWRDIRKMYTKYMRGLLND